MSDFSQYYDVQRNELHKSQISDDFVYWFRNGEDIFQAVLRKKTLKMSVLYWRVPYIWTYLKVSNLNNLLNYISISDSWDITNMVELSKIN